MVDGSDDAASTGVVAAIDGSELQLDADTICVHGDTAGCAVLASKLRAALEAAGIRVNAPRLSEV